MRRIGFYASLLLCCVVSASVLAEKVSTMPAPTGYVDDFAGVLSDSSRAETEALCRQVYDRTKAQIFVVTVHTLEGEPIAPFANALFHQWKIGEKKTDRGLLLLFAIGDHKRRIEVGYGLEGILNDAKVGDIGRAMVPALQAENYGGAVELGAEEVAQVIATDAGVTLDLPSTPVPTPPTHPVETPDPFLAILLILVVLIFVLALVLIVVVGRRRREFAEREASSGLGLGLESAEPEGSSPMLRPVRDLGYLPPLQTTPSTTRIRDDDSVAWSPGFGSDSSSTSSGADSGFSGGGGGDSGGGGADGSW